MVSILSITSWAAPLVTTAARSANFDLQGNSMITAMAEGGLWTTFLYVGLTKILSWGGLAIIGVSVLFGLIYVNKIRPKKQTSK